MLEAIAVLGSDAMEGVIESAPSAEQTTEITVDTPQEDAPAAPEVKASETLYIQNLNEKIKVDGVLRHCAR